MQKASRFSWRKGALIALLLIAAAGTYAWYSVRSSCEVEAVKEASAFLISQQNFYDRVYQVAVTASRSAPDHPVNTMKQVLMDTQEVDVPGCMQTAKTELVNYMGTVILAFDDYRAGKEDASILKLIKQSDVQYANFRAELRAVNQCAPNCMNLESIWNRNR
jgi:hypothetical protein